MPSIITCLTKLSTKLYYICQNKVYIPTICVLCDTYGSKNKIICDNCYNLLGRIEHACVICNKPLLTDYVEMCADCYKMPPAYDKVYCAFLYEEPLKTIIQNFKYHRALYFSDFLIKLMLKAIINKHELGLIIPTPLSLQSMQSRGYNQAAILAKSIAKTLKIPYADGYLHKTINTPNQAKISGDARRKNLENAFSCKRIGIWPKFSTKNYGEYPIVTIIDDILTTGSTAHAMALTLKENGVERVNIWCCARAY